MQNCSGKINLLFFLSENSTKKNHCEFLEGLTIGDAEARETLGVFQ